MTQRQRRMLGVGVSVGVSSGDGITNCDIQLAAAAVGSVVCGAHWIPFTNAFFVTRTGASIALGI